MAFFHQMGDLAVKHGEFLLNCPDFVPGLCGTAAL
jgi:hypothetical protein